jgi:hypothetical protein
VIRSTTWAYYERMGDNDAVIEKNVRVRSRLLTRSIGESAQQVGIDLVRRCRLARIRALVDCCQSPHLREEVRIRSALARDCTETAAPGLRLRIFVVADDCTRECLALVVDTSISGIRVARELDRLLHKQASLKRSSVRMAPS